MTTSDGIVQGIVQGVVQGVLHDFVHDLESYRFTCRVIQPSLQDAVRMGMILLPFLQDFSLGLDHGKMLKYLLFQKYRGDMLIITRFSQIRLLSMVHIQFRLYDLSFGSLDNI